MPAGNRRLGVRMRRNKGRNIATLLIDGEPAGGFDEPASASSASSPGRASTSAATAAARCRTTRRRSPSPASCARSPMLMDDDQVLDAEGRGRRRAGARMTAVLDRQLGRGQPLRLAAGLRVDVLHRAGRRRALPAGRGAEGDRRRVRRPPRRAVDGLHAGLLRHGPGRRVHGLAGRPHQPPGAAADRRRVDPGRRLAGRAAAASGRSISAT